MQLTQCIRVFPDKEQKETMWNLSETCRKLYNSGLSERLECWFNDYDISFYDQQNSLPQKKKNNPELKGVYSKVLQMVVRQLDKDFKSAIALQKRDEKASFPKFKGGKYFTTMYYNQSGFKVDKGYVSFTHNRNKTKLKFKIPDKYSFEIVKQISVFHKDDKFFLAITYKIKQKEYGDNKIYQAFDLGVTKHTAVNSKGKFIEFINQRPDKYWKKPRSELQSKKDHCKKYSRKWNKVNKNLNKIIRKESNQFKDFHHKVSRTIIDNTKANTIIIGKLEVKKLTKINKYQKGLHKSLHNTGNITRVVRFLTYKAELVGKKIIEINERGTSKTCCVCGNKKDMPLYKRQYVCDCGNDIDRDKNSSVNIMCRFLSQNGLWTPYQQFVGNLRQTGVPMLELHSQEAMS